MRIRLCAPNILSICWIIICLKVAVSGQSTTRNLFDYALYGVTLTYLVLSLWNNKNNDGLSRKKIIKYFCLLLFISIIGVIRNFTRVAVTSVIGVACVMSLVVSIGFFCNNIQPIFIKPVFYIMVFRLFLLTIRGQSLGNTTPGVLCFLSYGFLICVLDSWNNDKGRKGKIIKTADLLILCSSVFLMVYIGWKSDARTAVLTGIGVLIVFFYLTIRRMPKDRANRLFWFICVLLIIVTVIYINIHSFSWYNLVNGYSLSSFGKNLDSSRPALWSYSLASLSWWEVIIGKGTGVLPTFREYDSFHNSFIQLLMQNGIIGLICLIGILRIMWSMIAEYCDDLVCRMVLACFVGVMIYNSFECTLLQNKVFLGMCEWIVVCMGMVRSRKLSILENDNLGFLFK